jgi:Tfp pilus assembly major pilin PilA
MKTLGKYQQGITFLGLLIILAVIATYVLLGVRLYPLYYEKSQVINAMKGAANQPNAIGMASTDLMNSFLKNLNATTNIKRFNRKNIRKYMKVIPAKKNEPKKLQLTYQITNVFFKDVVLVMEFDHSVDLIKATGE